MRKLFFVLITLQISVQIFAQFDNMDQEIFSAEVSLVDEFFKRFNGEESHPMVQKDNENARRRNLLFLLDYAQYKSREDSLYLIAETFVDTVMADSIKLHYGDTTWIANALCHGALLGKPVDFTIHLCVERRTRNMYKWVITSVEGDILNLANSNNRESFMLLPDDHETNFMSLHRMTSETSAYITDFIRKDAEIDKLSVFLTLVKQNLLKIDYVADLSFSFFQVPGYIFSIKNINRNSKNAGWLISSIDPISEREKSILFDKITK